MAYNVVSLILDITDGTPALLGQGSVKAVPSAELTDATDNLFVVPAPCWASLSPVTAVKLNLLATDNANLLPSGWAWTLSFPGVPGNPGNFNVFLPAAPQTFTATNASPCVFTGSGSGYLNSTGVQLSGGSLPAGFTAATTYYVVNASGSAFQLAATANGSPLASTSAGSGSVIAVSSYLSSLSPVSPVTTMAAYMPLPSGTPSAGQAPLATGTGEASAWGNVPANPMTTSGDTVYGGSAGVLTRLAGDTSNTRKFLREQSVSGTAQPPAWDTLQSGDVPNNAANTSGTAAGLSSTLAIGSGGTGQTTAPNALNALGGAAVAGDIGGTSASPQVTGTHLASPLPVAQGGTSGATQQAALDVLAGAVTANQVLAGNGTHVTLRALAAADLPAATSGAQGAVQLTGDLGNTAASPQVVSTHLASPLPLTQGGTGQTAQQAAINALSGTQTAGYVLGSDGTNVKMVPDGGVTVKVPAPTGLTATDTPAVTAAITKLVTALGSGPATLLFQDGTYQVDSNALLIQSVSNFTVRSNGGTVITQAPNRAGLVNNVTGDLMIIADCTDFRVEGITFDGLRDTVAPITPLTASAASGQPSVTVAAGNGARYLAGQILTVFGGLGTSDQNKQDLTLTISSITAGGGSGGGDLITFTANLANTYSQISSVLVLDGFGPYACDGAYVTPYQTGSATVAGRTLDAEDQQNALHLISCSRFVVRGCTARNIWESSFKMGTGFHATSLTDGCSDARIEGNSGYHGYDQGVSIWASKRITVTGNTMISTGWGGCVLTGSDDCTVTGNIFYNHAYQVPNDNASGSGLVIEGGDRNLITANTCYGNISNGIRVAQNPNAYGIIQASPVTVQTFGLQPGSTSVQVSSTTAMSAGSRYTIYDGSKSETIFISSVTDSTHVVITTPTRYFHAQGCGIAQSVATDNVIAGNNLYGNGSLAREALALWDAVRTTVTGNTIVNNSSNAITASRRGTNAASAGGYGSVITGNVIGSNGNVGNAGAQIICDSVADLVISNNVIDGISYFESSATTGLVNLLGCANVHVTGNRIADAAGGGGGPAGIYIAVGTVVANAPAHIRISGNLIQRCYSDQVYVTGTCTGLDISNNTVTNGLANGITLSGVARATIQGNRVTGNKVTGVSLASSTYCLVTGNTVADDGTGVNPNSGNGAAQVQQNGIIESGTADHNQILDNAVYGNSAAQVTVTGANTVYGASVVSVTAADASVAVGGTAQAPVVATGTLDVIAAQHPPAADWSNNSHKITSLLNGSGAQDATTVGQVPLLSSAWQSLSAAPSGATGETFPRILVTTGSGVLGSGTLQLTAIGLPKGVPVNNISMATSGSVKSGGQHGWYVLLDSGMVVRAVSADQTDAATVWGTANTVYTLPVAGSAYTTTYTGLYYIGVMVAATTTMPTMASCSTLAAPFYAAVPVLCGPSSTGLTTPPAIGTTMAAISAGASKIMYGYTS